MTTATRWITTEPVGFLPAGVVIDRVEIVYPPSRFAGELRREWLRIRHPQGSLIGMVPADSDEGRAFIAEHCNEEGTTQ